MIFKFTVRETVKLIANWKRREADPGRELPDLKPVAKLFTPDGAATWLIVAMSPDQQRAYGIADLGLGEVEAGEIDLGELRTVRGRLGLPVEKDRWFAPDKTLYAYLAEGWATGRLVA
jgi:hypothetical protein